MPLPRRRHTAVVSSNTMIVFGGCGEDDLLNDIIKYNWETNEWMAVKPRGAIPYPRWRHTAIVTPRNTMLVFGGQGDLGDKIVFLNDVHEFDIGFLFVLSQQKKKSGFLS